MNSKLNGYETQLIDALLRAHESGLADLNEPFTSRQAVNIIADVPTTSGVRRSGRWPLPNKYKLTAILKKSDLFVSEKDSMQVKWWTLKSD